MNYCFPGGREGWVENKKTSGWTVGVRPSQIGWHDRRSRKGGRSFVFIRRKDVDLYVLRGSQMVEFSRNGLSLKKIQPVLVTTGGPANWDWEEIRYLLRN